MVVVNVQGVVASEEMLLLNNPISKNDPSEDPRMMIHQYTVSTRLQQKLNELLHSHHLHSLEVAKIDPKKKFSKNVWFPRQYVSKHCGAGGSQIQKYIVDA